MIPTVIVLSVLLTLTIIIICVLMLDRKKAVAKAKQDGATEFFDYLLKGGWEKKVNDFKEYNKVAKEGGIVFVGDSLTDNYNVYEYYKGYPVYNRGIGGDTTEGLLNRMKESIYDLKPSIVVLLIGINDIALIDHATNESIVANIKKIVGLIHENCPNTKIILESLYPVYEKDDPKIDKGSVGNKTNKQIDEINEVLKDLEGVYYLDVNSHLKEDGNVKLEYTQEGLHINTFGYHVVTKVIKEKIDEIK